MKTLNKDLVIEIKCFSSGEFLFRDDEQRMREDFLFNILDETGKCLTWFSHDIYKDIKEVYYCRIARRFWLPAESLYDIEKIKILIERCKDRLAFFDYDKAMSLVEGRPLSNDTGVGGLFS